MYVIIVYDVAVERVNKVNAFLKTYLNWIQNSVFEGVITRAQLHCIKTGLMEIVDTQYDAVYFFVIENPHNVRKEIMGVERGSSSRIV
ncbi:MAG: CRISPR-associated endonuclease Cas2 [Candidatus Thorarchaeota archaeon]